MNIEKLVDLIFHRQKCTACGFYTVYQAIPAGDRATDSCTHCGHQVEIAWHPEIKGVFKNTERLLRDMEEILPELKGLKNPGDHILLD
jgi:rRNA maturation protein Nop10